MRAGGRADGALLHRREERGAGGLAAGAGRPARHRPGRDGQEQWGLARPIWSIGPGKTPADKPYIEKIARFVKERTGGLDVVYGGGLKADNAAMLASIADIDGGLIALTRFSGEIGFYPEEYLEIIRLYLGH